MRDLNRHMIDVTHRRGFFGCTAGMSVLGLLLRAARFRGL